MGLNGLALATSIAGLLYVIATFITLRKKIGPFGFKAASISIVKILAASSLMGCVGFLFYNGLTTVLHRHVSLITTIFISAAVYFITIAFMKVDEFDSMLNAIRARLTRP